jgi:hypothetical protein
MKTTEEQQRNGVFYVVRDVSDPCEAVSNNSTVTLRVVGGDEKGSLKYETVASPKGLGPEKDWAGKYQQHIHKTDPLVREGAP